MEKANDVLKEYWGYELFRPLQAEIVNTVAAGNDTLALLPTGGGKSICFQVPGLMRSGITIVVTPLIALMKDQVEQLSKREIKANAIYSGLSYREIDIILDNCIYGNIKFLYVSPERLQTELFIARAKKMDLALIAIDEAHCISQWGYDFRPPYLKIAEFTALFPQTPVIALTATATEQVKEDIVEKLNLREPHIFQKSFARANLSYAVRKTDSREQKLLSILRKISGSAIVYINNRKATRETAAFLIRNGISADFYHAGLGQDIRSKKQNQWITDQIRVMVSTNAFGMGIDKPNVRVVVHLEAPTSPEAYYQEAGRAGRDGLKSYAIILYSPHDLIKLENDVHLANPSAEFIRQVYQALANYYKIAVGSNDGARFDFDINEFSNRFNLAHRKVYFAIKKMENEGLLQLNEAFDAPSKIWIVLKKEDLYRFQIENKRHDYFIRTLLRIYGGEMFTQFVKISEKQVARILKISEKEVINELKLLASKNIIDYDWQKEKPQLTFITPRFDSNELPLNSRLLKEREKTEKLKAKAIIDYIENTHRCRSQILLEYFGEVNYTTCGICDTCISNKKNDAVSHHITYKAQILHIISEHPVDIDQLIEAIQPDNQQEFLEVVRELVETQVLKYNERWQLQKT
ncbi:MAG: RecQ family ATP-dependent DNA helicase [Cyclobacteriaceae bacterium]|nr:RecQ family ATP-dependent DNA helicase [Cyclobacteriaceae bacterium]